MGFTVNKNEFLQKREQIKEEVGQVAQKTAKHIKVHIIDYFLVFCICFVLGAFDVFTLKASKNLTDIGYWTHATSRFIAYVLASIIGIRLGLPKARSGMEKLQRALYENEKLLSRKGTDFALFISKKINADLRKMAWINKINKKIQRLDVRAGNANRLYYLDKDIGHFGNSKDIDKKLKKYLEYETKRKNLEGLMSEEYIEKNLLTLKVKFYKVSDKDFDTIEGTGYKFKGYKTRANTKGNSARTIGNSLIFTVFIILMAGSISLTFNEALAEERILAIFTIIVNSILDVGITLYRLISAYLSCNRIVEEEELQATLEQNKILYMYFDYKNQDVTDIKKDIESMIEKAP